MGCTSILRLLAIARIISGEFFFTFKCGIKVGYAVRR